MYQSKILLDADVAVVFQPIISMNNPKVPIWQEALTRLRLPDGSLSSPGPLLDSPGGEVLERRIDCAILPQVHQKLRSDPSMQATVNTSKTSLTLKEWQASLSHIASDSLTRSRLWIEITEREKMTPSTRRAVLDLRKKGFRIAFDDFGSGDTTIQDALDIKPDMIKIDRQVVLDFLSGKSRELIAIQELAKHLDATTVAEGIETTADAAHITAAGIDFLQGFLFGKPRELTLDG